MMLTRDEILRKMNGFECPKYLMESCWQPIYEQAMQAIELAAENAQLKADLAALNDVKRITDNLLEMERINRMGDMSDEIKRLKAKLDEVRKLCVSARGGTWTINEGFRTRVNTEDILAILDKDGDV